MKLITDLDGVARFVASLRAASRPVGNIDDEVISQLSQMKSIMLENNGIGIAANQVGLRKRMFILKDSLLNKELYVINPRVVSMSGMRYSTEGCLSLPGRQYVVKRAETITIRYENTEGVISYMIAFGLKALIIQHELDHLDGITLEERYLM